VLLHEPTPPPVPAPDPTARRHDGFYLRLGLGAGLVRSEVDFDNGIISEEVKARGGGVAFELALGGTVAPGLVIGGGIYSVSIAEINWRSPAAGDFSEDGGDEIDGGEGAISVLGVMIDFYPNPRGGFHVQGGLGIGALSLKNDEDSDFPGEDWEGGGGGLMLGVGYEFWVSDQWSLGGIARVLAMSGKLRGSDSEDNYDSRGFAPAILFGATHH
jgi:hypothetical protein